MTAAEPDGGVEKFSSVLAALADPTRRRLLDLLTALGAATATTLARGLPVSRQAIVKHLAVLDVAGLVVGSRVGREVRYSLRPAGLDATTRWMSSLAADWDRHLRLRPGGSLDVGLLKTDDKPATVSVASQIISPADARRLDGTLARLAHLATS